MKKSVLFAVALVVAACNLFDNDDPSVLMVADVNSLIISQSDTLIVNRSFLNTGDRTVWFNASAPAFEMRDDAGVLSCIEAEAVTTPELVLLVPGDSIMNTREYPLATLANCDVGLYQMIVTARFRTSEAGEDSFVLRTPAAIFTVNPPTAP